MFLFSFLLMNRSMDRWFSPNISELRDDSTRVVVELAHYVASNARGEAESIAATGAAESDLPVLQSVLLSHRITLDNGFVIVYDKDKRVLTSFEAPPESSPASLIPWLEEGGQGSAIALKGPLVAQPVDRLAEQQRTGAERGGPGVRAGPLRHALRQDCGDRAAHAAGTQPAGDAYPLRLGHLLGALPQAKSDSQHPLSDAGRHYRAGHLHGRMGGALSLPPDYPAGGGFRSGHGRDRHR